MRILLIAVLAFVLVGCSLVHSVRVENVSHAPVTIRYKIKPAAMWPGIFGAEPWVYRKQGSSFVRDSTVRMAYRDSTITITLAPGDKAVLAQCTHCTYADLARADSADAWSDESLGPRMNLYWMRIERDGRSEQFTPRQLVEMATKRTHGTTLLRIR